MSKELWNERYAEKEYIYGTDPNAFLKEIMEQIEPGKILFPADGEGRNSTFAAELGWDVVAFDQSEEGRNKALKLAESKNVHVDYRISTVEEFEFPENYFDAIAMIYLHFPENSRESNHKKLMKFLKPGGLLILEAFSKDQVNKTSGGPKDPSLLYSSAILSNDFKDDCQRYLSVDERETELLEGEYHKGIASVVCLIGKK